VAFGQTAFEQTAKCH